MCNARDSEEMRGCGVPAVGGERRLRPPNTARARCVEEGREGSGIDGRSRDRAFALDRRSRGVRCSDLGGLLPRNMAVIGRYIDSLDGCWRHKAWPTRRADAFELAIVSTQLHDTPVLTEPSLQGSEAGTCVRTASQDQLARSQLRLRLAAAACGGGDLHTGDP